MCCILNSIPAIQCIRHKFPPTSPTLSVTYPCPVGLSADNYRYFVLTGCIAIPIVRLLINIKAKYAQISKHVKASTDMENYCSKSSLIWTLYYIMMATSSYKNVMLTAYPAWCQNCIEFINFTNWKSKVYQ